MESQKEVLIKDGKVVITFSLIENENYMIYEGFVQETNKPCLIKQIKKLPFNPEEEIEQWVFSNVNSDHFPKVIYPYSMEPDGQWFIVLSHHINGQNLKSIIRSYGCLSSFETNNILLHIYDIFVLLAKFNISLCHINSKCVFYAPNVPNTFFFDISSCKRCNNSNEIKESFIQYVKMFMEEAIPWVFDSEALKSYFWNKIDEDLINFYISLSSPASPDTTLLKNQVSLDKWLEEMSLQFLNRSVTNRSPNE